MPTGSPASAWTSSTTSCHPDVGGPTSPVFYPVFYEGYRNSIEVAAEVCDELGLTGVFVCTGFVDCPVAEQEVSPARTTSAC